MLHQLEALHTIHSCKPLLEDWSADWYFISLAGGSSVYVTATRFILDWLEPGAGG